MESVHVVFDDIKIEGLTDEGYHEGLKVDNVKYIVMIVMMRMM